jgi:two-component system, NarL family, response regulator NreC
MIRALLADDHQMFRQGLSALLASEGIQVVGDVDNGMEAVRLWDKLKPDVAILDVAMPMLNGLDAAREILRSSSDAAVVLLTMFDEDQYQREALEVGVTGYVLKSKAAPDLLSAIREVLRGGVYFTGGASRDRVNACLAPGPQPAETLTTRERQVLQLVAEGKTTKEAAAILTISVKTADSHRQRIMKKLNAHCTADLVRYAVRRGVVRA